MATSGSFQSNNEKYCNLYVEWKVTGQSVANNTSTVQVDVYLKHHALNIPSKTLTINFGSTVKNITTSAINVGSSANTTKIGSATFTAWHNANGTKSLTISATMPIGAYCDGTYFESVSASGSATFNQIARPTTPTLSATTVELGQSVTINMARNLSSLTHTLTYSIGANSGTIGSSLGTSKPWTPEIDLAHQITKSTSGVVTITCKTYSGSTLIGTKTVNLTVTVPASVVPTLPTFNINDATNCLAKYGSYVQNQSKFKFDIVAKGAYSSTVTNIKVEVNGNTLTASTETATLTTGVLTISGTNTIKVTITDSRGRNAVATYTRTVIAYTKPKATISAYRCDSSGNENPEGAYIKATISGSITSLNSKNSKTFKIQYKKATDADSVYDATANTVLKYTSAYSCSSSAIFAASEDDVYNIRAVATDDFNSTTHVIDVSTAYTIIDFKADGKGIAFGKASTEDGFDVNMQTRFRQDVRSTKDVIAGLGESDQCSLIETHKSTQGIVAENLIPYPYIETTHTQYGIAWTDKGDGTVKANGTNTETSKMSQFYFNVDTPLNLKPNTTYTLSGCPSGGSTSTYRIRIIINYQKDGQVQYSDVGNGVTFTTPSNYTDCRIMIDVNSGVTVNNLTFNPMLEKGSTAHPWQPYNLSRQGLVGQMIVDNLLTYPYVNTTKTTSGITYTDLGDGRIRVSGTPTDSNNFICRNRNASNDNNQLTLPAGTYMVSGCPVGGSLTTYYIQCGYTGTDGNWASLGNDYGDGVTFTLTKDTIVQVLIIVDNDCPNVDVIFEPMLEPGTVKHPYQPHSMSRKGIVDRFDNLQPHPYSLIISNNIGEVTTTQTTFNTYNSRKISDYGMVLVTMGSSHTDVRKTLTLPRAIFTNRGSFGITFYLDCFSNNGSTFNQIAIKPVSETQIVVYKTTSTTVINYVNIYGIKIDDVAV